MKKTLSRALGTFLALCLIVDPSWGGREDLSRPTLTKPVWSCDAQALTLPSYWIHPDLLHKMFAVFSIRRSIGHRFDVLPSLYGHHILTPTIREPGREIDLRLPSTIQLVTEFVNVDFLVDDAMHYLGPHNAGVWAASSWIRQRGLAPGGVYIVSGNPPARDQERVWPRALSELVTWTRDGALFIHEEVLSATPKTRYLGGFLDQNPVTRAILIAALHDAHEYLSWKAENIDVVTVEQLAGWHRQAEALGFHLGTTKLVEELYQVFRKRWPGQVTPTEDMLTQIPRANKPAERNEAVSPPEPSGVTLEMVLKVWAFKYAASSRKAPTAVDLIDHIDQLHLLPSPVSEVQMRLILEELVKRDYLTREKVNRGVLYHLAPAGQEALSAERYRPARLAAQMERLIVGEKVFWEKYRNVYRIVGRNISLDSLEANVVRVQDQHGMTRTAAGNGIEELKRAPDLIADWLNPDTRLTKERFIHLALATGWGLFRKPEDHNALIKRLEEHPDKTELETLTPELQRKMTQAIADLTSPKFVKLFMKHLATAGGDGRLAILGYGTAAMSFKQLIIVAGSLALVMLLKQLWNAQDVRAGRLLSQSA